MNNSLVIFFKNKSLFEIFDEIKDLFEYNIKFIKSSDELKSLSRNILEQHVVISEKTIRNLNNLTVEDYKSRLSAIQKNYETALTWWEDNDRLFTKYLKEFV